MSNLDDRERQAYAIVDDALKTFPLSPVSPALYLAIMARVRATQPVARLSLGWIEYALALLGLATLSVILALRLVTPAEIVQSIEIDMTIAVRGLAPPILVPTLCAGIVLVMAAISALAIVVSRPSTRCVIRPR